MRFILFLPVGETDMMTSTLLPQIRQMLDVVLFAFLAATSVFDFFFSAIFHTSFLEKIIRLKGSIFITKLDSPKKQTL